MPASTLSVTDRVSARRRRAAVAAIVLLTLLLVSALDNRLAVQRYVLAHDDINRPIRIALVTDLHSCRYGEAQEELINTIASNAPDLLLLGGDIFDDEIADTYTEQFLAGIAGRYPCYYVTGNHEYWSGAEKFADKMAILAQYQIPVLSDETVTLTLNGAQINLCGVNDPDAYRLADHQTLPAFAEQLDAVSAAAKDGLPTILLSHRPEYFEAYAARGFDLVLCGHAHGGQWRIPFLLNGLYAPDQGPFPRYAGGLYVNGGTTMIVSRGLARETTIVPRIFNRPELVIVDLT